MLYSVSISAKYLYAKLEYESRRQTFCSEDASDSSDWEPTRANCATVAQESGLQFTSNQV